MQAVIADHCPRRQQKAIQKTTQPDNENLRVLKKLFL
jgi:hypothetical protein